MTDTKIPTTQAEDLAVKLNAYRTDVAVARAAGTYDDGYWMDDNWAHLTFDVVDEDRTREAGLDPDLMGTGSGVYCGDGSFIRFAGDKWIAV